MEKKINNKKHNLIYKLNNVVIITTIITLLLGIADFVLDILHNSTKLHANGLGTPFLILGIVMSIPGLAWIIINIIMLVKDKKNMFICKKARIATIIILAIAAVTFIPLWIEGFIDGNNIPMFERLAYRQVIWMLVWIVYLLSNVAMFLLAYTNRCKYLFTNKK